MLATARRFSEEHANIRIEWTVRTLQEFGDASVRSFAENYDLIVVDHPFMGAIARDRSLVPLDEHILRTTLDTLANESAGVSHQSYFYEGHQWALAIDAASQVAGYRPDLLRAAGVRVPETWEAARARHWAALGWLSRNIVRISKPPLSTRPGWPRIASARSICNREASPAMSAPGPIRKQTPSPTTISGRHCPHSKARSCGASLCRIY